MRRAAFLHVVLVFPVLLIHSPAPLPPPASRVPGPEGSRPAAPPSVHDLSWLEGIWHGRIGGREFEAHYTGPDGGQILSASKYTENGRSAGFEFERFEEQDGKLVLTPFPEGKSSVTFELADYDAKARRVVFENLAHDFPTRISYQRIAKDRLTILVSGPGEDGKEQVLTYALEKRR